MKIRISQVPTRKSESGMDSRELVDAVLKLLMGLQMKNPDVVKNTELLYIKDVKKLPRAVYGDAIGFKFQDHQAMLQIDLK